MQRGKRVYYHYTGKNGLNQKFPAIVLAAEENEVEIRIGRLNVATQKIDTAVFGVARETLSTRNSKCNYEEDLLGNDFDDEQP